MKKIDIIHFNSSLTRDIYYNFFTPKKSTVINITHSGIERNILNKRITDIVKFTYVGAFAEYKGFDFLIRVMDKVFNERFRNFELNIYGDSKITKPYINNHKPYSYSELKSVMMNTDIMIVSARGFPLVLQFWNL